MTFKCKKTSIRADILGEMAISEVNMNTLQIPPGWLAPAALAQTPAAQKPKQQMSAEDAFNTLKLVNVGKHVLEMSSLNLSPEEMILLTESIKSARKNGMGVEFENGRINIPEELFQSMIRACKKGPDRNLGINDITRPKITYT